MSTNEANDVVNDAASDSRTESGSRMAAAAVPVRGIAMIILAVGLMLLAWGVYSMVNNSAQPTLASQNKGQNQVAPAAPTQKPAQSPAGLPGQLPSQSPAVAPQTPVVQTPGASASPAPAATSGETPKVYALNNSTVQGLANRMAEDIKKMGFTQVESGNFPNEVLPHSVVYFTPGDAAEEQAARKIADQLKITAQPRIDALKGHPAGVVLVITSDLNR